MTLEITPIVSCMPSDDRLGYHIIFYLEEFESLLKDWHGYPTTFDPGTMLIFTGARVKAMYNAANKRRAWVRALNPEAVYALGVDAFEEEVD